MVRNRLTPIAELHTYLGVVQVLFDRWRSTQREVECGLELGATDAETAICVGALEQLAQAVADLYVPTPAATTQRALLALMRSQLERYLVLLREDGSHDAPTPHTLEEIVTFSYALHQLVARSGAEPLGSS